jgi:hypothetical protein
MPASELQKKPPETRYIQRLDTRYRGWKVAINWRGTERFAYFADARYGGSELALQAAQMRRDEMVRESRDLDYRIWRRNLKRDNASTGITGVHRCIFKTALKDGGVSESMLYQAYWMDILGKRRTRAFSVGRYGEAGAKELAIQARADGMAQFARDYALQEKMLALQAAASAPA